MAENSKIEWTRHTFNPWVGCTRISPACDHCYAEGWAKRTRQSHLWEGERRRTSASNWQQPQKWDRAAAAAGERHRVFCASLADVFDNQVPTRWRDDLWHLIDRTPNLDWMLLTKRPQNIARMLPTPDIGAPAWGEGWRNVWLGTTVEDRARLRNIIVPGGGFGAIVGQPGCGKSFLALDLAFTTSVLAIAEGEDARWFGRRVRPVGVAYIAAEGQGGFRKAFQRALDAIRVANRIRVEGDIVFPVVRKFDSS